MQELHVPDATVFVSCLWVENNTTNTRQCPHLVSLAHSYVPLSYEFHSSPDLNQQSPTENSEKYYKGVNFYYVLKPVKSTDHVSAYCPLTKINHSAWFLKIAYTHTGQKNYKKGLHLFQMAKFILLLYKRKKSRITVHFLRNGNSSSLCENSSNGYTVFTSHTCRWFGSAHFKCMTILFC